MALPAAAKRKAATRIDWARSAVFAVLRDVLLAVSVHLQVMRMDPPKSDKEPCKDDALDSRTSV